MKLSFQLQRKKIFFQVIAIVVLIAMLFTTSNSLLHYFSKTAQQDVERLNYFPHKNSNIPFQKGSSSRLTGFVTNTPSTTDEKIGLFTSEEGTKMSEYDEEIIRFCKIYTKNTVDCFYLLKSVMSITSKGDPTYVDSRLDEQWQGLIPLPPSLVTNKDYEDIFTDDLDDKGNRYLFVSSENIEAAAKYIMALYARYNEDLQFTIMAYLGGVSLSNEFTRIFINNEKLTKKDITSEIILDHLEDAYKTADENHDLLLSLEDVKERFQNLLLVYEFWSQKPLRASSPNEVLYEFGTFSVRPSFSVKTRYNSTVFEKIKTVVKEFIDYENTLDAVNPDYSFSSFRDFMNSKLSSNTGETANDNDGTLSQENIVWYDTACTSYEVVFYSFVSRFIQCLNSEQTTCGCSFSDFKQELDKSHTIRILQTRGKDLNKITFQLLELKDDYSDTFILEDMTLLLDSEIHINYDDFPEFSLDVNDGKQLLDIYYRDGSWNTNGYTLSGEFSKTTESTGAITIQFEAKKKEHTMCSIKQSIQLYCVRDPKTFVYRKYPSGYRYEPLEFHFALGSSENNPIVVPTNS